MPIELTQKLGGKVLEVAVSGKLAGSDYERFVPAFETLVQQHGKMRVLFEMSQFHGWDAKAAWDDFKFGVKHYHDIERLAVVGETKWQQWLAEFGKPFTAAQVRYFELTALAQARAWLEEGLAETGSLPAAQPCQTERP